MITPRVLSLDLDDTLWHTAPVLANAERDLIDWLRSRHPEVMRDHDMESMRALRARVAARFPQQSHDMTFVRRRALIEQFSAPGPRAPGPRAPGFGDIEAAVDAAMEIFMVGRNRVVLYDDVRPALQRLRGRYRLFALSNGNADLARCGIADLFEGHVTAAAAGVAKPDAKIFTHLAHAAGVEPIEVLHVGDDPLADVVGATRAGMQSVWLNRDARPWPAQFAPPTRTAVSLADIA